MAADQTLRLITPMTASGEAVRIRLSNVYGAGPVSFSAVSVGVRSNGAALAPGTLCPVTFGRQRRVVVGAGTERLSDPVSVDVRAGQELAVSLYVAGRSPPATWHLSQPTLSYFTASGVGDQVMQQSGSSYGISNEAVPWLTGVDVLSRTENGTLVVLGDSVTNGSELPPDRGARWTDVLSRRLQKLSPGSRLSVANEGIGGDGATVEGSGGLPSGEARVRRDALEQPGIKDLVIELGINDLAAGVSATALEQSLLTIAAEAKREGVAVLVATIPPAATIATRFRPSRHAVNRWIRHSHMFAGVIDFDAVLRDPSNPDELLPAYDSGDHVHPNASGDRAMADSVKLGLLTRAGSS